MNFVSSSNDVDDLMNNVDNDVDNDGFIDDDEEPSNLRAQVGFYDKMSLSDVLCKSLLSPQLTFSGTHSIIPPPPSKKLDTPVLDV